MNGLTNSDMINRKQLLGKFGLGAAALVIGPLCAEQPVNMPAAKGLAGVASQTAEVGKRCLTHCIDQLAKGDDSMAGCAQAVRDMVTACTALASFAAAKSKHTRASIAMCQGICKECKVECDKHAHHHAICKECADACERCMQSMKAA